MQMRKLTMALALLASMALLTMILPACSSSDDPGSPGDGGTTPDTTPPVLQSVTPDDGYIGFIEGSMAAFQFNEPLDQASIEGQVTVSQGSAMVSWVGDTQVAIMVTGFDQGTELTITIGTGLTDTAGNALAAPVSVTYWTYSEIPLLLTHTPGDGAFDVNRGTTISLTFSEPMNTGSFATGITINDDTKAPVTYTVETVGATSYRLTPDEVLAPTALITVALTTDLMSMIGSNFAASQTFTFTTGETVDLTPPTIIDIDPASGSVIPVDQGTVTIVFSEPIDASTLSPSSINGQLAWVVGQSGTQPSFNQDFTEMTVTFPATLPAGVPLEAAFANYADLNGNVQTGETSWSCTVAGTADPVPIHDGLELSMTGVWSEGVQGNDTPTSSFEETIYYRYTERSTAGHFDKEEHWDPSYSFIDYKDILGVSSSKVELLGFGERDNDGPLVEFTLDSPLTFLELPFAQGNNWTDNTTLGPVTASLTGEVTGPMDITVVSDDETTVTWTDVWKVELNLTISEGSGPADTETITNWYAPGVGIVREYYHEDYTNDEDNLVWTEYDRWLDLP
jgi:hypothetical protein